MLRRIISCRFLFLLLAGIAFLAVPSTVVDAQTTGTGSPGLRIDVTGSNEEGDFGVAIQLVIAMTILTLGPSVIMMMTCFTRIVIVLGFVRNAIGVNSAPSSQIIVGLALFLTFFIMTPTLTMINNEALAPYLDQTKTADAAIADGLRLMKDFLINNTRESDLLLFSDMNGDSSYESNEMVPLSVALPAFITSELKTAFQIGFLLFLPFLVIDMVVASILMSLGMMMLSPMLVAMPFKLLLFVLVDGWAMTVGSLAATYALS